MTVRVNKSKEKKEYKETDVSIVDFPKSAETLDKEKEVTEKVARKKTEVKSDSVKVRTQTRLEVLADQEILKPDTETPETIDSVDIEKIIEEKEANEALEVIGGIAVTILAKFFNNGVDIDSVDTIEEFKTILDQVKKEKRYADLRHKISSIPEKSALKKLEEAMMKPGTLLYKKLSKDWSTFISKSKEIYKDASKGKASKAWEWAKDNPGKVALAIVGAYALWNIAFKKKSDTEKQDEKNKNWTDRLFNRNSALALGVLAIGALIGSKKISEWLSENLIGKTKDSVIEAAEKVKKASFKWLDEKLRFSEIKSRLLFYKPDLPDWIKNSKLEEIAEDMGITQENTDSWQKYDKPGGAILLLSDWGKKRKLDEETKKALESFIDVDEKIEYYHKDYGEMVPANEALKNYSHAIHKDVIDPLVIWSKEHPGTMAFAALHLAQYEAVRSAAAGGLAFTADSMWQLAKLPFTTVRNFPLSTIFGVSAILLMKDNKSITDKAGNIMIPKDPENLKKYIKQRMIDSAEFMENMPGINDKDVDTAVEIIENPSKLKQYFGSVEDTMITLGKGAIEAIALSPEESLEKANKNGISFFLTYLLTERRAFNEGTEEYEQYSKLIEAVQSILNKFKSKESIIKEDYEELNIFSNNLDIRIYFDKGFVKWAKYSYETGLPVLLEEPRNLAIDPSLSHKEAIKKAKYFTEKDSFNGLKFASDSLEFSISRLRTLLSEIIHEKIETDDEAKSVLERKLRSGDLILAFALGKLFIIEPAKGIIHKYVLGWANPLLNALDGDFSATEAAYDYANGLVSVMFLGAASRLAKLDFRGGILKNFGNLLWRGALYPVSGPYEAVSAYRRARSAYRGEPGWYRNALMDHKTIISSDFHGAVEKWKYYGRRFLPVEMFSSAYADAMVDSNRQLMILYEAKSLLVKAKLQPKIIEEFTEKTTELLEGAVKKELTALREDREGLLIEVEGYIENWERHRKNLHEYHNLHKARNHLLAGNTMRAEICIRKLGSSKDSEHNLRKIFRDKTKLKGEAGMENALKLLDGRIEEVKSKISAFKIHNNETGNRFLEKYDEQAKSKSPEIVKSPAYPPIHEQEANVEEIKRINEEIAKDNRKKQTELTEARTRAAERGEGLQSESLIKTETEIEAKYNEKHIEAFNKRQKLVEQVSPEILKKHAIEVETPSASKATIEKAIQEVKSGKGSKARRFGGALGRGLGAAILGLAVGVGASVGIEKLRGRNEVLDLEAIYLSETAEKKTEREEEAKRLEESPRLQENVTLRIQDYLRSVHDEYNEFFISVFTPEKLKKLTESDLINLVELELLKHSARMEKIKKFLAVNRDALVAFYKSRPNIKERDITSKDITEGINLFALGFDEESDRPYLKYADQTGFKQAVYSQVDMMRKYIDKYIEGKMPETSDHIVDMGLYIVPVVGTYRDGRDAYNAIRRGDWETAAWSGTWTLIGGAADILLATGIGSVAGAGLRGIRGAVGITRGVVKGAEIAKDSTKIIKAMESIRKISAMHYGKITFGAMGADLGRQLVKPELNEKYEF